MPTSDTLQNLYSKINSHLGEIDNEIKENIKKIKKDYNIIIIETKIELLKTICNGEKLDFNKLKEIYLTEKERKLIKEQKENKELINEELLSSININNDHYFYEDKENGKIFNKNSKIVGIYKNGKFNFN